MHGEPGLAPYNSERRRRDYFVRVVIYQAGPDDSLRLDDFAKNSVHPMVTVQAAHAQPELSAVAEVHLALRHGEVVGREPTHQMFGFRPREENQRTGRVEDARDGELAIANGHFAVERHRKLSFPCVTYSPSRPSVCPRPSTAAISLT